LGAAPEREHCGIRVAEHAADGGVGREAGEGVEVAKRVELRHAVIVTDFRRVEKAKTATNSRGFGRSVTKIYPH